MKCLVLDAMGVIFQSGHIVSEILIPFVKEKGGSTHEQTIRTAYNEASLGIITAEELWEKLNLSPTLEDEYLACYTLMPGILELLKEASNKNLPVWCLSNDVSRWSDKLQNRFGLTALLAGSVISADVGVRKPDENIFKIFVDSSGYKINDLYFVDDKLENVQAAKALGIKGRRFENIKSVTALLQ